MTTPAAAESHGLLEGWLIPLILVLVLLLLVGMVLWRRRDKPAEDLPPVKLTPKTNLSKPALTGAAAGAAAAGVAAAAAPPLRNTPSLLDEPMLRSSALDTPPQTPAPGLPAGSRGSDGDFDRVAASDTKSVNVGGDSNDPLSEADFHLAYGLYDEAAALLKQAIARDPERSALRMKLAETYFAAGRPLEFQEVAEEMHNKLGPAEWNRVAGMGRQLAPGAALFAQSAAAAAPPLAPAQDLDFAFDLPSPTLKTTPAPQDHFVLPEMDVPAMAPPAAPAAAKSDSHIDFDLEQELLKEPAPASAPAPKPDLDLADFDLDGQAPKKLADVGTVEFNLDELDLSDAGSDGSVSGPGDEMGTKLDLARAYSDMGDNDAARGLLGEVVKGGSPSQKQEAEALLQRLSA